MSETTHTSPSTRCMPWTKQQKSILLDETKIFLHRKIAIFRFTTRYFFSLFVLSLAFINTVATYHFRYLDHVFVWYYEQVSELEHDMKVNHDFEYYETVFVFNIALPYSRNKNHSGHGRCSTSVFLYISICLCMCGGAYFYFLFLCEVKWCVLYTLARMWLFPYHRRTHHQCELQQQQQQNRRCPVHFQRECKYVERNM